MRGWVAIAVGGWTEAREADGLKDRRMDEQVHKWVAV